MSEALAKSRAYFEGTFAKHGATPRGLDWNGEASQHARLQILTDQIDKDSGFSLNDVGCGFGTLIDVLDSSGKADYTYTGYDLVEPIINEARLKRSAPHTQFLVGGTDLMQAADYTIACGIFNMKQDIDGNNWQDYVFETLTHMLGKTRLKLAANFLTSYSDDDRMRDDLWYPDPAQMFSFGMKATGSAAILHNYGYYDFTLVINQPASHAQ